MPLLPQEGGCNTVTAQGDGGEMEHEATVKIQSFGIMSHSLKMPYLSNHRFDGLLKDRPGR